MYKAAFFDLDKTLVSLSTEKCLVKKLHELDMVGMRQLIGVLLAYLKYRRLTPAEYSTMKKNIIRDLLRGKNRESVAAAADAVFREVLEKAIYPEALQAIERHGAQGCRIYIVSAAVDAVVELFAARVGAAGYYSTSLEVVDGVFTGNVRGEVCYGAMKGTIVENIADRDSIDLARSHAYGDYYEDRFMLESVGYPVAVNPDKKLERWASEKGWTIVRWGN